MISRVMLRKHVLYRYATTAAQHFINLKCFKIANFCKNDLKNVFLAPTRQKSLKLIEKRYLPINLCRCQLKIAKLLLFSGMF